MEEISAFAAYSTGNKKKNNPKKSKEIKAAAKSTKNANSDEYLKNKLIRELVGKMSNDLNKKKKKKKSKNAEETNNLEGQIAKKKPVVKRLENKAIKKTKGENVTKKTKVTKNNETASNGQGNISIPKNYDYNSDETMPSSKSPSPNLFHKSRPKPEPRTPCDLATPLNDSIQDGLNIFKYLLAPVQINKFFAEFWEKEPCLVQRNRSNYFSNLISFEAIDEMLLKNHVEFTKHIDITSYNNGVRETLNPEGRALPGAVWDFYESGCSIRLLNPQIFIPAIYTMNTTLQEYFHCMVGANVYLTPPSSQGFAPHYDDIEAFVLQIEGKKRWKLYNPRNNKEVLPRVSSKNFNQDEIGEPILDKVLKPGDILYFPRGTIHQAKTEGHNHSLHITLSIYQKHSYADLFEILFPMMLSKAIQETVELRRGLPLNIWHNLGVVHSDTRSKDRDEILKKSKTLLQNFISQMPIDEAVDQMAKKYQHDALPPDITGSEHERTVYGVRTYLNENGTPECNLEINDKTNIRLLRANILRMVEECDKIHVYFYTDNSREYHEYDPNFLEINPEDAPAVEFLIKCYPEYVAVKNLPIDDDQQRIAVVQGLFHRGLLMLDKHLI